MRHLILIRHGKSAWNHRGLWTGWTDVELVEEGKEEARKTGHALKGITIHKAFISELKRTKQTLEEILNVLEEKNIPIEKAKALNERHYGIHTGKNKWQVKEEVGEEKFQAIRRGWDEKIPEGETLKDVHERVKPYYESIILPELKKGSNVLIVAHGNSLRAMIKHIENIHEDKISKLEIATGEIHMYTLDEKGTVLKKEVKSTNETKKEV